MSPQSLLPSVAHSVPETAPAPFPEPSDQALLEGFGRSEPEAVSAFVARFQRRVYGLALTILGDSRAAEDVAQEAFLRAWRHADIFDARRGTVVAWLMTIARNLAIDAVRRRRPISVSPDELLGQSAAVSGRGPAEHAVMADDISRLRDALAALPDGQRRVLALAGIWGISAREIAELERIPVGTVKTRIRTGLRRLRAVLHDGNAAA
jgi:RNA polymerase sigma factor (sigma-70 family)